MILPLFPLELAVFPGEVVPLHIFEPRYKQLISECHDNGATFGIPPVIDGQPARFGTELKLERILTTYKTGEMDVLTLGLRAFRLERFLSDLPDKLYSGGEITRLENEVESSQSLRREAIRHFHELQKLLNSGKRIKDSDQENLSFLLAQSAGLSLLRKVELLSMTSESGRLTYILEHLIKILPELKSARKNQKTVGGNGHLKDFRAHE